MRVIFKDFGWILLIVVVLGMFFNKDPLVVLPLSAMFQDEQLQSNNLMAVANKIDAYEQENDYTSRYNLLKETITAYETRYNQLTAVEKNSYNFLLIKNGNDQKAVDNYIRMLKCDQMTDSVKQIVNNNLAWAYTHLGEYERAVEYALKALDFDSNDAYALNNLANGYWHTGRIEKALESYDKAIEAMPRLHYPYQDKAKLLIQEKRYKLAVDVVRKYIELKPDNMTGYSLLYQVGEGLGDESLMIEALKAKCELSPNNFYDARMLASIYYDKDDTCSYQALIETYLKDNGEIPALMLTGSVKLHANEQKLALMDYKKIIQTDEAEIDNVYWIFDDIYYFEDQAFIDDFTDIAMVEFSGAEVLEQRLSVALDFYDEKEIKLIALRLLKINPKNILALSALGDVYFRDERYTLACEYYQKVQKLAPDDFYNSLSIAECFIELGKYDEAEKLLLRIHKDNLEDIMTCIQLARLYMLNNNTHEATFWIDMALTKNERRVMFALQNYEELRPLLEHTSYQHLFEGQ